AFLSPAQSAALAQDVQPPSVALARRSNAAVGPNALVARADAVLTKSPAAQLGVALPVISTVRCFPTPRVGEVTGSELGKGVTLGSPGPALTVTFVRNPAMDWSSTTTPAAGLAPVFCTSIV